MELDINPLFISVKTALTATFITFFLGLAIARWMVNYQWYGKGLLDAMFTLPMVLPPTVVGFILLVIFGKEGPLGRLLLWLGTNIIFSWPATVVCATVVALPLMYKTARGGFEQVDPNLINAARTLGASEWRIFWQLTIPLTWPSIAAGTVLAFARAMGEFGATLMLAGNIPNKTQTIPLAIFFASEGGELDIAYLWVAIIMAISLFVVIGANYWTKFQRKYLSISGGD